MNSFYPLNIIPDYYLIDDSLSEEQKIIRSSIRYWVEKNIVPNINNLAINHQPFPNLIQELANVGALGIFIPEKYGGLELDYVSYGIIMQELERGDSSVRSVASVQNSLVMHPIFSFGSESQKNKYLPELAQGKLIGCFGLTEPDSGSDPSSMKTNIKDCGSYYELNGSKMWITNAPICDIAIVWAKDEQNIVRGLIVDRNMQGFTTTTINNKWSLQASLTGELFFDRVQVPKENVLINTEGMKSAFSCLNSGRYGISWGVIGAAIDCYCTALHYSKQRFQFNKTIASFQLQQKKLAEFITEITKAQLLSLQLGNLMNSAKASSAHISMAKRNNVKIAIEIARESRQILGAIGITGDFPIMRHINNLESVITYEGTHDIHLLITGLDITKISSFF